jgi:hypothetical protein
MKETTMIRRLIVPALFAMTLAACGADGMPVASDIPAGNPGVSVTGEAQIGVTGTL